jgi:hypothetical protein
MQEKFEIWNGTIADMYELLYSDWNKQKQTKQTKTKKSEVEVEVDKHFEQFNYVFVQEEICLRISGVQQLRVRKMQWVNRVQLSNLLYQSLSISYTMR